jgi:hypothetical protein
MRLAYLFVTFFAFLSSCQPAEKGNGAIEDSVLTGDLIRNPNSLSGTSEKLPEITFETTSHDFGKMNEGDKVQYEFLFTNTGEAPLIISDVQASCGCTTPKWPRGVIKSGESNAITVEYNSTGRPGEFSKGIVVVSNAYPNQTTLKISGVVFKK